MTSKDLIIAIFQLSGCKTWFEFSHKAKKNIARISEAKNGKREMLFSTIVEICENTEVSLTKAIKMIDK